MAVQSVTMSVTGDILTANSPARLLCRRGKWLLELVRFVSVDRNVFQPRTQRIEGSEAILQHLKRGDHAPLAASTSQLMRGLRPDEEHAFEAVDGEWVAKAPEGHSQSLADGESVGPGVSSEVAELRAELLVLRVTHERLRERVLRLESQVVTFGDVKRSAPSVSALGSLTLPKIELPRASPEPVLGVGRHAWDASPAVEAPPVSIRPEPRIKFPPASAINGCLRALIGDKVSVREKKLAVFAPIDGEPYWLSPLIDDDGVEAGMIVADLMATVTLGGQLMMLPPQELDEQRKNRTPSQDAIEAMGEVSNNLSATFNQLPDAIRLRVKPIEALSPGALDWVTPEIHKLQLEVAGGMGNLYLFSR
ncbi:MAG: hypothetical protein ABW061_21900 [Polyangiaceae bacterium]